MKINWRTWEGNLHVKGYFIDSSDNDCVIGESMLTFSDAPKLRLGVIMDNNGNASAPMSLTIEEVEQLIPILQKFVTGRSLEER